MFYGFVGDDEDVVQYICGGGSFSVGLYCFYYYSYYNFSSCYRYFVEGRVMKVLYSSIVKIGFAVIYFLEFLYLI